METSWGAPMTDIDTTVFFGVILLLLFDVSVSKWYGKSLGRRVVTVGIELFLYLLAIISYGYFYPDIPYDGSNITYPIVVIILYPVALILLDCCKLTFQYLYREFWKIMYKIYAKKDSGISLDNFRDLFILYKWARLQELPYTITKNILRFSFYTLNFFNDLLPFEALDEIRIRYGIWINYFTMSHHINYEDIENNKSVEIKVIALDFVGGFNHLKIYYKGQTRSQITLHIKTSLSKSYNYNPEDIVIKIEDLHHVIAIFAL